MSYSFSVSGATKAAVKQLIADGFKNVVETQPSHAADRDAAVACASAFVDTLADPRDGAEIVVSMHGSLGWKHDVPEEFLSGSIGVSVTLRNKPAT